MSSRPPFAPEKGVRSRLHGPSTGGSNRCMVEPRHRLRQTHEDSSLDNADDLIDAPPANCMSANSGNYSINGVLPSSAQNGATRLFLSNDASQLLFGDAGEGSAGLVVWEGGSRSFEAGVGQVMTAGRRTASIPSLNIWGKTGPAPRIPAKTGAEKLAGWLTGVAEIKMAIDVGATGAEAIGCLIPQ